MTGPSDTTRAANAARPSGLRRFLSDRRGVAAIEFAFIAPVLLVLYMMTMEIAQAIDTNKKVSRVASMVADLVTQQLDTTKADLNAIMTIGDSMLRPYNRTQPAIEIEAIQIDGSKTPKIVWSRKLVAGATSAGRAAGTVVTVPEKLKIADTFIVNVKTSLSYAPVIAWVTYSKTEAWTSSQVALAMGEEYYLRPRRAATITCTDC